jgi:hypothetical protein
VTVRFDTDHLSALAAAAIPKIPLVENQGVILRVGRREWRLHRRRTPWLKYSTCRKRAAAS